MASTAPGTSAPASRSAISIEWSNSGYAKAAGAAMDLLHDPEGLSARAAELFAEADADKSGRVRAAEIRPALDGLASELGADRGIVDDEWLSLTLEADEDKFNVLLHMLAIRVQGSLREGGKVLHPAMHAMIVHPSHFDDADTDHNGSLSVDEATASLNKVAEMAGAKAGLVDREWVEESMAPDQAGFCSVLRLALKRMAYHSDPKLAIDHINDVIGDLGKDEKAELKSSAAALAKIGATFAKSKRGTPSSLRRAAVRVHRSLLREQFSGVPAVDELVAGVAGEAADSSKPSAPEGSDPAAKAQLGATTRATAKTAAQMLLHGMLGVRASCQAVGK